MKRSLALFGLLALICGALTGCSYHAHDGGHYSHGRRWHTDSPRYYYGGYHGPHHGHYRHGGYHHGRHREYCD